ncbi:MAG: hypothetical protein CMF59_19095 [Leptospiraceae bacterium]|nr:hypothetical protein [Leptospiraceae bacterium]|tara:strand:- start:101 stop:850 length:750 start_codon:yes stop_codon:yes gene_type:complete
MYLKTTDKFLGMQPATLAGKILTIALICALSTSGLAADTFGVYQTPLELQVAESKLPGILDEFQKDGYSEEEETLGFSKAWSSDFFSPYNYSIYTGTVSLNNKNTIIRLEGDSGDVKSITRILELKGFIEVPRQEYLPEPITLYEKSHLYAQGLNFLAPWAGVMYTSWDSPRLTTGQTYYRTIMYFLVDSFLIWAAGRNWFQEPFDISKNGGQVAAVMVLTRSIGAFQSANLIRGHNRFARMGYTFYLE